MRCSSAAAVASLILSLICIRPVEAVPADDDKTETEKRLLMAQQLTNIRESGSQPFRLSAKVQLFDKRGDMKQGTYELVWESPTQWKDELKLADFSQIRLVSGERLFLSRNPSRLSMEVFRLLRLLEFPILVIPLPSESVSRQKKGDGFEFRVGNEVQRTLYLDGASSVPVRIESHKNGVVYLFQSYNLFGERQFPRILTEQKLGKPFLEVQVQQLAIASFSPSSFAPPADAPSFRWCPSPTPAKFLPDNSVIPIPWPLRGGALDRPVILYGIMGADGQWHNVTVVKSGGKEVDSYWTSFIVREHFIPAMCGNEPVMQESVQQFGRPD
jgi:hypothetical protein